MKAAPLAAESLLAVAQSFGPLLPVWIGLALLDAIVLVGMGQWYAARGPEAVMSMGVSLAFSIGPAVVAGPLMAFAVRGFLKTGGPLWRFSWGVLGFTAVQGLIAALETALPEYAVRGVRAAGLPAPDGSGAALTLSLLAYGLILALEVRFVLWQTRLVADDAHRLGPVLSWRASGGTVLTYLSAYLLVSGALVLIHLIAWSVYLYEGSAIALGVALVTLCVGQMTGAALSAEYYKARLAPGPAAVFE